MIESIFVIVLVCLCFFGVYQYASLYSTKAVLYHAVHLRQHGIQHSHKNGSSMIHIVITDEAAR